MIPAERARSYGPRALTLILLTVVTSGLFAGLAVLVAHHGSAGVDLAGHGWALTHRGGAVTWVATWATRGGETSRVAPVVVVVGFVTGGGGWWRRARAALLIGAAFGGGVLVRLAVADLIARPRPPRADWVGPAGGYAFPSGHTATAALGAALVAWAVTRRIRDHRWQAAGWAVAGLYATAIGWSRVWLGVHWPTDVVGSCLLAAAWLAALHLTGTRIGAHRQTADGGHSERA